MNAKIFTLEDARAHLPEVKDVVDRMRELRERIIATRDRITVLETLWGGDIRSVGNPDSPEYDELRRKNRTHVRQFRVLAEELDRMGCHIKDFDRRTVGFFHVRDGQAVFLSWHLDDPANESYEEIAANARIFSLVEAKSILPRLREIFAEFDRIEARMAETRRELGVLEVLWGNPEPDTWGPDSDRVRELSRAMREYVVQGRDLERELHTRGCQLKDFQNGLIDFYHVRNGQVVFLCWKRNEPDISAWHPLDEGFGTRRDLGQENATE